MEIYIEIMKKSLYTFAAILLLSAILPMTAKLLLAEIVLLEANFGLLFR